MEGEQETYKQLLIQSYDFSAQGNEMYCRYSLEKRSRKQSPASAFEEEERRPPKTKAFTKYTTPLF